jgi:ABC-type polysaccharide/polyol phosphate export permease
VEVDVVVIESGDVAIAIAEKVAKHGINKLVIGASSRGFFTRYSLSMVYILCTIIFLLLRTGWKWLLIFLIVPLLAYFSICIMDALINKLLLIFVGNIRDYHLESQNGEH